MEWNSQALLNLSQNFIDTLSPLPEFLRRTAESNLSDAADIPNYGLAVLRLIAEKFVDDPTVDEVIRESAAVHFTNYIKSRWWSSSPPLIPDSEKAQIKALIIPVMLSSSTTPGIQSQLIEAISVIGKHTYFHNSWPDFIFELSTGLEKATKDSDYASIHAVLALVNSLSKKFRYDSSNYKLCMDSLRDLTREFVYFSFIGESILQNFEWTAGLINSVVLDSDDGQAARLRPLIESQRLCCSIFYSLTYQELSKSFYLDMDKWMSEFKNYVTVKYSALEDGGVADGVELVDGLRVAVCDILSHEEMLPEKYLDGFLEAVWHLLVDVSVSSSSRDRLALACIKFLANVSTSPFNSAHPFLAKDDVLQQICIIIPNAILLRDEDQELFEANWVEFIRRDMEDRDLDTRRRISSKLLNGIATNFKDKVFEMVSKHIQSFLAIFGQNPAANWKYKECAIYLVVSLATKKGGVSNSVSTDLVDVENFFGSVVVPELQSQDVNEFPMLKAGALKFFTIFRNQISKPVALTLLPDVVRFLNSKSNVVHSYAASCVEKLLLVKDDGARARYTAVDIGPYLLELLRNLFNALEKPDSEENQYMMKCIMRLIRVGDISAEVVSLCISGLTSVLNRVCKNPQNTIFNHHLSEAVVVLVRQACEKNPSLVSTFEASLLPSLEFILAHDVSEFFPCAFQLLAQLVKLNRSPIPPHYIQIFHSILLPELWDKPAYVPGLVRLLHAFLRKAPHELSGEERLIQVAEILKNLVASKRTDELGFYLLNTIIDILEYDVIAPYLSRIWTFLLWRLRNNITMKFDKNLVIFMSLFLIKHGPQNLEDSVNAVQPGKFMRIIEHIWIPNLERITGSIEMKLTSVASSKLICESPVLLDKATVSLWWKMLDSIVTLLSSWPQQDRVEEIPKAEQDRVEEDPEVLDVGEMFGYNATWEKEEDPLKEIMDPKQYLLNSLVNCFASYPARFPHLSCENLHQANFAASMINMKMP